MLFTLIFTPKDSCTQDNYDFFKENLFILYLGIYRPEQKATPEHEFGVQKSNGNLKFVAIHGYFLKRD